MPPQSDLVAVADGRKKLSTDFFLHIENREKDDGAWANTSSSQLQLVLPLQPVSMHASVRLYRGGVSDQRVERAEER